MKGLKWLLVGLVVCALSVPAFAHFQMIYTPEPALDKGKRITLKLVFTHPFEAGHTMDIGKRRKGSDSSTQGLRGDAQGQEEGSAQDT